MLVRLMAWEPWRMRWAAVMMSRGDTSMGMSPGRAEEWARGFVRVCVVGATLKLSVTFAMPDNPRLGKENTRESIFYGVGMLRKI